MQGERFNDLPADAVAIAMRDNDNPLEFLDIPYTPDERRHAIMTIIERTDTTMTMACEVASEHGALSIGAITSADRQVVYWVNDTRPLP